MTVVARQVRLGAPEHREPAAAGPSRLQFLESIRGVASLVVVFYHSVYAFWPYLNDPGSPRLAEVPRVVRFVASTPLAVAFSGEFAVVVFFVLSGFVLSYSFFCAPRVEPLTSAALRRYWRLAIPSLLSVLIAYALIRLHANHNGRAGELAASPWLANWNAFTPSLFSNNSVGAFRQGLYGAFFRQETSYNNVLWTMGVELPGSFLVYSFLALFGAVHARWLLYVPAWALLSCAADSVYLGDFILGLALCDAYVQLDIRHRRFELGWASVPLLVLGLAIGGYRGFPSTPALQWVPIWLCPSIGAAWVIAVPLFSSSLRRWMGTKPLAWLGRISFGLYLIHVLLILSLSSATYVYLRDQAGWSHDRAGLLAVAVLIPASLLCGWAMHYVADLPSIAIGKWFASIMARDANARARRLGQSAQ